jgi:hypothetical protein
LLSFLRQHLHHVCLIRFVSEASDLTSPSILLWVTSFFLSEIGSSAKWVPFILEGVFSSQIVS